MLCNKLIFAFVKKKWLWQWLLQAQWPPAPSCTGSPCSYTHSCSWALTLAHMLTRSPILSHTRIHPLSHTLWTTKGAKCWCFRKHNTQKAFIPAKWLLRISSNHHCICQFYFWNNKWASFFLQIPGKENRKKWFPFKKKYGCYNHKGKMMQIFRLN